MINMIIAVGKYFGQNCGQKRNVCNHWLWWQSTHQVCILTTENEREITSEVSSLGNEK